MIIQLEREFLHVTLDVNDGQEFERRATALLPTFEGGETSSTANPTTPSRSMGTLAALRSSPEAGFGWTLVCSAKSKLSKELTRYLHLWRVPSPPNLGTAMHWLATDVDYAALHKCVVAEVQDICRLEDMYSPTAWPQVPPPRIFHESFELEPAARTVAHFQFWLPWLAADMNQRFRWKLLVAIQHETGKLGTRKHLWRIPEDGDQSEAADFLATHDLYRQAVRNRQINVFTSVNYRAAGAPGARPNGPGGGIADARSPTA